MRSRGLPRSVAGGPSLRRLIEAQRELTESFDDKPPLWTEKSPGQGPSSETPRVLALCGEYATANGRSDEVIPLAEEKNPHCGRHGDCSTKVGYLP